MKRWKTYIALDAPSTLGLYLLTGTALVATCVMALLRSSRLGWMAGVTVLFILLTGLNHLRVHARFKRLRGHGVHRRSVVRKENAR